MAAVKITDEDDYISPSQSCINPLFTSDRKVEAKSGDTVTEPKANSTDSNEIAFAERKRKAVRRRRMPLELKIEQENTEMIDSKPPAHDLSIGDETIEPPSTKATLSVADCLACSGCITSAEAVLVTTKHSIDTLKNECSEQNGKSVVFTISPAVIADITRSLMKYWDHTQYGTLTSNILYQRLSNFLKLKFHAKTILDGSLPQRISLLESGIEFCHRYQALYMPTKDQEAKTKVQPLESATSVDTRISLETPSISLSATQTRYLMRKNLDPKAELEGIEIEHDGGIDSRLTFMHSSTVENPSHVLPMLSSSCPGFVCYVEKTVPEIIPNLCTSKSPMAIAGSIFKHQLLDKIRAQEQFGIPSHIIQQTKQISDSADSIYHVAIMPCYDKALEANRKDLAWSKYQQQQEVLTPDVDLVITSNQLLSVLAGIESESGEENREELACKVLMSQSMDIKNSSSVLTCNHEMDESQSEVRGSGSYAEFIFRFASLVLFGYKIDPCIQLQWKSSNMYRISNTGVPKRRVRSRANESRISDSMEVSLYRLQNGSYSMVGDSSVDEVVLRFSTCYGFKNIQLLVQQLSSNTARQGDISHFVEVMACPGGCINGGGLAKASSVMKGLREKPSEMRQRIENTRVYLSDSTDWIADDTERDMLNDTVALTHTRFHVVPKLELSTGATAGVKVDDTQW